MSKHKSESQYLLDEAEQAKAAMRQTVEELKSTLQAAASPSALMQDHPWAVLGAAVAAGFGLGTAARGMARREPRDPVAELVAAMQEHVDGKTPSERRPKGGRSRISSLLGMGRSALGDFLKTAARDALVAAVSSHAATTAAEAPPPSESSQAREPMHRS